MCKALKWRLTRICKPATCPSNDWSSTHLWNRFSAGSGRDYIYRTMMIIQRSFQKTKDSLCTCASSFELCQFKALNKAVVTAEASGHGTHKQPHILQYLPSYRRKQSTIYPYKTNRSKWKTLWLRSWIRN